MKNANQKKLVRKLCLKARIQLPEIEVNAKSRLICLSLFSNFFLLDKNVGIYMPIKNEVNPLFLKHYNIFDLSLPIILDNQIKFKKWTFGQILEVGKFGVLRPNYNAFDVVPDVVLVPIVAFDENLNRIGYGGGFYDRFLKDFKGIKIGLAFEMQKRSEIGIENFDSKLDYIVTESNIYF